MPSGIENFTQVKKLGQGGFGTVFLVRDNRDQKLYVMKEVDLSKTDEKGRQEALKEASFLKQMSHPNIIGYNEYFEGLGPPKGRMGRRSPMLYIVMAYADGGDLEAKIKNARGRGFSETQVMDWLVQVLLALKHIHDRKILHRDIKTQNIFLTRNNTVKLGDFGIAKNLAHTFAKAKTQIGTPYYLSPEICSERPYDAKSDIWAVGVVLYEMMCLKHPFTAQSMPELLRKIVHGGYLPPPRTFSKDLRGLLDNLLKKDPRQRPSVNEILGYPFIRGQIKRFLDQSVINEEFSHTVIHGPRRQNDVVVPGAKAVVKPTQNGAEDRAALEHLRRRREEIERQAREQERQAQKRRQDKREQAYKEAAERAAADKAKREAAAAARRDSQSRMRMQRAEAMQKQQQELALRKVANAERRQLQLERAREESAARMRQQIAMEYEGNRLAAERNKARVKASENRRPTYPVTPEDHRRRARRDSVGSAGRRDAELGGFRRRESHDRGTDTAGIDPTVLLARNMASPPYRGGYVSRGDAGGGAGGVVGGGGEYYPDRAKPRSREEELAEARIAYFRERKEAEARHKRREGLDIDMDRRERPSSSRYSKEEAIQAHQQELAKAREEYYRDRMAVEKKNKAVMFAGPELDHRRDDYDYRRGEPRAPNSGRSRRDKDEEQRIREEELARARKESYLERKALEEKRKRILAEHEAIDGADDFNRSPDAVVKPKPWAVDYPEASPIAARRDDYAVRHSSRAESDQRPGSAAARKDGKFRRAQEDYARGKRAEPAKQENASSSSSSSTPGSSKHGPAPKPSLDDKLDAAADQMYISVMADEQLRKAHEKLQEEDEAELALKRHKELLMAHEREEVRRSRELSSSLAGDDPAVMPDLDTLDDKAVSEELIKEKKEAGDFLQMLESFRKLLEKPLGETGPIENAPGAVERPNSDDKGAKVDFDDSYLKDGKLFRNGEVIAVVGAENQLIDADGKVVGVVGDVPKQHQSDRPRSHKGSSSSTPGKNRQFEGLVSEDEEDALIGTIESVSGPDGDEPFRSRPTTMSPRESPRHSQTSLDDAKHGGITYYEGTPVPPEVADTPENLDNETLGVQIAVLRSWLDEHLGQDQMLSVFRALAVAPPRAEEDQEAAENRLLRRMLSRDKQGYVPTVKQLIRFEKAFHRTVDLDHDDGAFI